jgi:hypothetical protein
MSRPELPYTNPLAATVLPHIDFSRGALALQAINAPKPAVSGFRIWMSPGFTRLRQREISESVSQTFAAPGSALAQAKPKIDYPPAVSEREYLEERGRELRTRLARQMVELQREIELQKEQDPSAHARRIAKAEAVAQYRGKHVWLVLGLSKQCWYDYQAGKVSKKTKAATDFLIDHLIGQF